LGRTVPGTFAALAISYLHSTTFNGKRPKMQRSERSVIDGLVAVYVGELPQVFVQAMVDKKAEKSSPTGNRAAMVFHPVVVSTAMPARKPHHGGGVERPTLSDGMMASAQPSSLYPSEAEIALRVLGEGKVKQWAALVPTLEREGLPRVDPLFGARFWPAVRAWFERRNGLRPELVPSGADGQEVWK
jgi:hypothetical protein